jgi:hypothetical protein
MNQIQIKKTFFNSQNKNLLHNEDRSKHDHRSRSLV